MVAQNRYSGRSKMELRIGCSIKYPIRSAVMNGHEQKPDENVTPLAIAAVQTGECRDRERTRTAPNKKSVEKRNGLVADTLQPALSGHRAGVGRH